MIQPIPYAQIPAAMDMVWQIFWQDHRTACESGQGNGVRLYLRPNSIRMGIRGGRMQLWGYYQPLLCGVLLVEGENHVGLLYVQPHCQGQGIGRALLAFAEAHLRERGVTQITLNASEKGLGFYRHCGYAPCGERKAYDRDIWVTPMAKDL